VNGRYTIHIVDDDDSVRDSLCLLFQTHRMKVISFADPTVFLSQFDKSKLGPLLFDLQMPQITGLELQQRLLKQGIDWPIIIVTGFGDLHSCRSAFQSGVVDFLTKPIDATDLFHALNKAERALDLLRERDEALSLLALLTHREREILNLVCGGFSTNQIATALYISNRTVDNHRAKIVRKLGTSSVVELLQIIHASQTSVR